jgi:hypothetical protein
VPPDWVTTPHNISWFDDELFRECYQQAVDTAGWDYRIPWRVHQLLWCLASTQRIIGDIVELGTGRGFMMAAAARFELATGSSRKIHLFDLFVKPDISGEGDATHAPYYADSPEQVAGAFASWKNVCLHVGDVRETVAAADLERVSFVHVDLNNPMLERECLDVLWPSLSKGSMLLLDDYANKGHEDTFIVMNRYFAGRGHRVLTTPAGQGIVVNL